MSVQRDRFTFFAVLAAVAVAVFGYVKLGSMYPTAGRAASDDQARQADPADAADGGEEGAEEEADHSGRADQ
ncbi:MAG: hypothetical protein AAGA29_07780 [Planctomycetota bacterium]